MDQIARFYVGTYSRPLIFGTGEVFEGKGKGIHTYLFDMEKGTLMEEGAPTETANPSFVSLSADKELLYAVNELTTFEGKKGGALNIYRREKNGELTLLSQKATGGEDPCHVVTDRERKMVLVSNYSGGSLAVWPLDKDGAPVGEAQVIQHTGKGRNPVRQEGPHVHSITFTRDEKYAVTVGGGHNHRYNLSDGVMLKDNHIGAAGGIKEAVAMAKDYAPFVRKIEVETENLDMVKEAVEAGADIIMLDNMDDETMKEAVKLIDGRAETECSGNVTKERLKTIREIGVDYVSCGALTHSAPIMDISLKNLHPVE